METVLITGAARRLGSLIAGSLASSGCFVWIHYRIHEAEAFELRDRILRNNGHASCVRADLTQEADIAAMIDVIKASENGGLTTLINNASIIRKGTLQETTPDVWDAVMNTNLKAVWFLSCKIAREFPELKRIITIGDANAANGMNSHAVYGLSKFALKYLTEQMAAAFAPGIRVNLLSPGLVLKGESEPEAVWQKRLERVYLDNSSIVASILKTIRFLMDDPGMTGAELPVDSGIHLRGGTGGK
ncbi:MAG: SDR family oxidoreductase [Anaerolineaceae bacterium]|nr:SDR family oxidoreductase [Anaerolineaceae bacterium]